MISKAMPAQGRQHLCALVHHFGLSLPGTGSPGPVNLIANRVTWPVAERCQGFVGR